MDPRLENKKMKTCYFCKGPVKPGRTDYMACKAGRYALVKNLSVELCVQCGEAYLDDAASRQIDEIVSRATAADEHLNIPVVRCQ